MLVCPASLKIAMARLRRVAMVWEPVRVWEASSPGESPHAHQPAHRSYMGPGPHAGWSR